jgi:hypothetical protein
VRSSGKRIREAAKELETSNDPKDFEKAFNKVAKEKISVKPEKVRN